MSTILGPDGLPVTPSDPRPAGTGLDLGNPVEALDLLGPVSRGCYQMAHQFSVLAGPKGERHVKLQAAQIAGIAGQAATVSDFAANAVAELAFTLMEAEARIAVLMGMIPEDKVQAAREADNGIQVEWQNRRGLFAAKVPILTRKQQRLGLALSETAAGPAPTQEDFDKVNAEMEALGFKRAPKAEDVHVEEAPAQGFMDAVAVTKVVAPGEEETTTEPPTEAELAQGRAALGESNLPELKDKD